MINKTLLLILSLISIQIRGSSHLLEYEEETTINLLDSQQQTEYSSLMEANIQEKHEQSLKERQERIKKEKKEKQEKERQERQEKEREKKGKKEEIFELLSELLEFI